MYIFSRECTSILSVCIWYEYLYKMHNVYEHVCMPHYSGEPTLKYKIILNCHESRVINIIFQYDNDS